MLSKFITTYRKRLCGYGIAFIITTTAVLGLCLYVYWNKNFGSTGLFKEYKDWFYYLIISAICYGILLATFIVDMRKKYYEFVTGGKSLSEDKTKSKKTMSELVHFKDNSDPHKMNPFLLPEGNILTTPGMHFGQVSSRLVSYNPKRDGIVAIITGNPGTGKTVTITNSAISFPGSVFGIEYKIGDITDVIKHNTGRKVKIFSPENPEESCHFNPLRGFWNKTYDEQREYLEKLASIIIPDNQSASDSKYFTDTARDFFCGLCFLILYEKTSLSFSNLLKSILRVNYADAVRAAMESNNHVAQSYLSGYYGNSTKNVSGGFNEMLKKIRNLATDNLSLLFKEHTLPEKEIIPEDLENKTDIFIQVSQKNKDFYSSAIGIITTCFLDFFLSRPEKKDETNRPILFILDEAGAVLNLSYTVLKEACASLRSKNVSLLFALQSLEQWNDRYGTSGCASLVGTARYLATCTISDLFTRKFYSELIGSHIVHSKSVTYDASGHKISETVTEVREPVFQPEDFGDLNDKEKGLDEIIVYADGKYIRAEQIKWYNLM